MSRVIICAICVVAVSTASIVLGKEPSLPDQPKDFAHIVRQQLPSGWRCTHDFRTLVISYDEPVTFLNTLSLPSAERNDSFFKEFGVQGPYLIIMKFVSRLNEADQLALVRRRQQAVDEACREHAGVPKYTAVHVYLQHFVPEYFNHRFSIDLQTSDTWPLELVAPAGVVKQRDAILKLLHDNLHKYPESRKPAA